MEKKFVQGCTKLQKLFMLASLMKLAPVFKDGKVFVTVKKQSVEFNPFENDEQFKQVYNTFAGKVSYWSDMPNFKQLFVDSVLYYHACPVKLSELSLVR